MCNRLHRNTPCALILLVIFSALPLLACGPFFPNRVLIGGDNQILGAPVASFDFEVNRIDMKQDSFKALLPANDGNEYFDRGQHQTELADVSDLKKALQERKLQDSTRNKILTAYTQTRQAIRQYNQRLTDRGEKVMSASDTIVFDAPALPDDLPLEFSQYMTGAILLYQGKQQQAMAAWVALLKLPRKQRIYRSTWAAFMLGKTLQYKQPEQALQWYQDVRHLVDDGFTDSLGLASASLGWEAQTRLQLGDFGTALQLYLQQWHSGDNRALSSLQFTASKAFRSSPPALQTAAQNSIARQVLTAYVNSRGGAFSPCPPAKISKAWLQAIETSGLQNVKECDRLAWAAYSVGDMELAGRWLAVADSKSPITQWLQVKLFLRAGNISAAGETLKSLSKLFPPAYMKTAQTSKDQHSPLRLAQSNDPYFDMDGSVARKLSGELGYFHLSQREYGEALSALLQGLFWEDAAYIAEMVLTADEFKTCVDRTWNKTQNQSTTSDYNDVREKIRYILARRLTRIGRWKQARAYYPKEYLNQFDNYISAIRKGHDKALTKKDRAKYFWQAACVARDHGMDLLGYEGSPDWTYLGGSFERYPMAKARADSESSSLFPMTGDERKRSDRHTPESAKRYHYRYTATDHAWSAAQLLPDHSDTTANILCIAGRWIAGRDPQSADRFYKALALRCGNTALGQQANTIHWFPNTDCDKDTLFNK